MHLVNTCMLFGDLWPLLYHILSLRIFKWKFIALLLWSLSRCGLVLNHTHGQVPYFLFIIQSNPILLSHRDNELSYPCRIRTQILRGFNSKKVRRLPRKRSVTMSYYCKLWFSCIAHLDEAFEVALVWNLSVSTHESQCDLTTHSTIERIWSAVAARFTLFQQRFRDSDSSSHAQSKEDVKMHDMFQIDGRWIYLCRQQDVDALVTTVISRPTWCYSANSSGILWSMLLCQAAFSSKLMPTRKSN